MIVFAGPSVSNDLRARYAMLDWRAPAVAGDFHRLLDAPPAKVLLIDGLFDERASVKHKEALFLMAAGTRLYGASSMGALRAAELASFGMIPLGVIAAAYCEERLVGDDEVALIHGDEKIDFRPVSVPMVEVRATLCRALRTGMIDPQIARRLRSCWHDIHYVDRDWPAMLASANGVTERDLLEAVAALHVPLKRHDAQMAIDYALADERPAPPIPTPPQTWFVDHLSEGLKSR